MLTVAPPPPLDPERPWHSFLIPKLPVYAARRGNWSPTSYLHISLHILQSCHSILVKKKLSRTLVKVFKHRNTIKGYRTQKLTHANGTVTRYRSADFYLKAVANNFTS